MPFVNEDKRTAYATELATADIGRRVTVNGWCARQRNLGSLIFIDLRDRSGIIQLAFDESTDRETFETAANVRSEYVLTASGVVRSRGADINVNRPTGTIEIAVDRLKILCKAETPPFFITEGDTDVRNELRMRYRYLDLRRPEMMKNIIARSEITKLVRDYYHEKGFIEIETPNLIKPTPEGARDYLVPSRIFPGNFFALPQSPQLYKQLIMYAGFDRYIQIARCYRDEDLRADRQPEFTQIDMEMSFVTEDDVMDMNEGLIHYLYKKFLGVTLPEKFPRIKYAEAMERFGSDKPDIRFGFELCNLTDLLKDCTFRVFEGAIAAGGSVRAINVKGGASFTRREIDSLGEVAKQYGAKGLAWRKKANGEVTSSYAKFLSDAENAAIDKRMDFSEGDLIVIVADNNKIVFDALGALRRECAARLGLLRPDDFKFLWVVEFPLFEYNEEDGRFYARHHPFTAPMEEDIPLIKTNPGTVRARAYDIVLNGTEIGGGSIRISTPDMQGLMFETLGIGEEEAEAKFGFLLEALKYGIPPHGGLAFGLDRLVALTLGYNDIRDVIAFPKAQNSSEPMSRCPAPADPQALHELGIAVINKTDDNEGTGSK
jgi:aspartyl-tRNA synthetase